MALGVPILKHFRLRYQWSVGNTQRIVILSPDIFPVYIHMRLTFLVGSLLIIETKGKL